MRHQTIRRAKIFLFVTIMSSLAISATYSIPGVRKTIVPEPLSVPKVREPGSSPTPGTKPSTPESWYVPKDADFAAYYEADAVNMKWQTWKQYWDWVADFYASSAESVGAFRLGKAAKAVESRPF